jgi:hypothetical protein
VADLVDEDQEGEDRDDIEAVQEGSDRLADFRPW